MAERREQSDLLVRRYDAGDEGAVLALLATSLGWDPDDRFRRYFAWKHRENAFGTSPAWVALHGDRVIGYRAFVRWEFEGRAAGGAPVRAVRAVDTATHPDHRGRGVFSRLTRTAVEELRRDGVAFVFNTPNAKSRPGYLKMGWRPLGRPPVRIRLRSPAVVLKMMRSRTAGEKWSVPTEVGVPAVEVLAHRPAVEALLRSQPATDGLRTRCTPAFLAWRYGFEPLGYRALLLGRSPHDGMALFRLHRRGTALEASVGHVLAPGGEPRATAALLRAVARRAGADHVVCIGVPGWRRAGFLPAVGQGPELVWRGLAQTTVAPLSSWRLTLGDVELF